MKLWFDCIPLFQTILSITFRNTFVIMDLSERYDSSIADEEQIEPVHLHRQKEQLCSKLKLATVAEIKNFERMAENKNEKFKQNYPSLFSEDSFNAGIKTHFISDQNEDYFQVGQRKQISKDVISKDDGKWQIRIPITNIRCQSILQLSLLNFKKNRTITIESKGKQLKKLIKYKYTFSATESTFLFRVLIYLQGEFKIWKQMQIPLINDKIQLQIHQHNNEQTVIKINDFLFHLILKMPYYSNTNYLLIHNDYVQIKKIELKCLPQGQSYQESDTHCSNQCQII